MASWEGLETKTISVTTTSQEATFAVGIQGCYLVADANCFVDFDVPAIASSSLLIVANQPPAQILFGGSNVQKVTAITASSTANLYILGVRGKSG